MESASIPAGGTPAAGKRERPAAPAGPIGRAFDELGEFVGFSVRALRAVPGSFRYFSEAMRINALITRRTSVLLFLLCGFLAAEASNFAFFLLRSLGASDLVGIVPGVLSFRQLIPQMFAYVFAGSVCCGIAAELGSAKVQQEIAAYESVGVDPMELLVGSRIVAVLLYVPAAMAISFMGYLFGSYMIIVVILHGNTTHQFLTSFFSIIPPVSVIYCTITVAILTLQCVLVACFYGMRTGTTTDAVGKAVSRSLGINIVVLHIVISLLALVFYGGTLGLPIGD